jgi:hypothetical protein
MAATTTTAPPLTGGVPQFLLACQVGELKPALLALPEEASESNTENSLETLVQPKLSVT